MKIPLEFKATTKFNPENLSRRIRKNWLSIDGRYRITWRNQYMGIALSPRYFALRLNKRVSDGKIFWDFALNHEHRPYKTFKRAVQACQKAAGIEEKPKRRKHGSSKGNLQTAPQGAVRGTVGSVCDTRGVLEERPVGPMSPGTKRGKPPVAQNLQVKRGRGRPKGSKNKGK